MSARLASSGPRLGAGLLLLLLTGCELAYPEIVVVNRTAPQLQLRNVSFGGCLWSGVLAYGEATSPKRCLPGEDRVRFERFDAEAWAREQAEESEPSEAEPDQGDEEPLWFRYQTSASIRADWGELRVLEIGLEGLEQDFEAPGPYGH